MNYQQILEALKYGKGHDIFPESKNIKSNMHSKYFEEEIEKIKEIADIAVSKEPEQITFSHFRLFDETGNRGDFEGIYLGRRKYLNALILMFLDTLDNKYLRALEDHIFALINDFSWAIPASYHGESLNPNGWNGIPHRNYLDLCSTETAFTLAEIDYLIGDKLSPLIRKKMKDEVMDRVLSFYVDNKTPFLWEDCDNNWAAVCGGSVGGAAIYYIEDDEILARYLERVLKTMECFLKGYDEDGACIEGVSYWSYGFSYYIFFSELLKNRTNGKIDLLENDYLHNISLFQQRMRITNDIVVNFSDCRAFLRYRTGMLHILKSKYDDVIIPPSEYAMRFGDDHCFRFPGFIRDYTWFNEKLEDKEDKLCDGYFFRASQIYLSRKGNAFFGAVGGNNGYSHNHNDLGHFIYYVDNKGFFIDIGQGIYTKDYFSANRYKIINTNAKGHSLPVIDNCIQTEGTERCASFLSTGENSLLDLTKAYSTEKLEKFHRNFQFLDDGTLNITDSIKLKNNCEILEQFIVDTEVPPELKDNNIILTKGGTVVNFKFDDSLSYEKYEKIPSDCMPINKSENMYIIKFKNKVNKDDYELKFTINIGKRG